LQIRYDKLWKLLEFCQLSKSEFQEKIEISDPTMTKLTRNKRVSMDIMLKICKELHCDIGDVMEVKEEV